MKILGISAYYHDSAAALIENGSIVAAAQEERFTRKKHDAGFPVHAINFCLTQGGVALRDVDLVAFYDKPFLTFERLLETYVAFAPRGFSSFRKAIPVWIKDKLFQKSNLMKALGAVDPGFCDEKRLLFCEHHFSHAASAFFPSPFEQAVVLTLDGVGEWATCSVALGNGASLAIQKEMMFPHSLGLLYSAFTFYTGFKVNSGEYKLMGLAPYGTPRFAQLILDHLIDLKPDGSFRLDLSYFDYCTGLTMTNERFDALFGQPARRPDTDPLTPFHMDVAASIQAVTEEVVLRMTRALAAESGVSSLCLAGGVALNCVANGKILRDGAFDSVWIQPAAGDAGGALGAALAAYHVEHSQPRQIQTPDAMRGGYLGPDFSQSDIETRLADAGAVFIVVPDDVLYDAVAEALAAEQAVGWFQGRMEFGPRALGGRSILGTPRSPDMQKTLNLKVKFRESFRPFAPSVLAEDVAEWFDLDRPSPYMLIVADVKEDHRLPVSAEQQALFGIDKLNVARSVLPAVTHVDYSARIQSVHADTNPRYHALLTRFKQKTGCGVLVNTSFNVRGEPIVGTPEDAFRCFMGTGLDVLACGNALLYKKDQDTRLATSYEQAFDLD